jgi:hypothetical protein
VILGWTLDEWAYAAGRYSTFSKDFNGAELLKKKCNYVVPGGIEGIEYPKNIRWALDMATEVISRRYL